MADTITSTGDNATIVAIESNSVVQSTGDNAVITAIEGNSSITSTGDAATITALNGSNTIANDGSNTNIKLGEGSNSITSTGDGLSLTAGDGNNTIDVQNAASTYISVGNGQNVLGTIGANSTLIAGDADYNLDIASTSTLTSIKLGNGVNTVQNAANAVTIISGNADDSISNTGSNVLVNIGEGANSITNTGDNTTLIVADGNDCITNSGNNVSIDTGAGDDFISNSGADVTIYAAQGNATVSGNGSVNIQRTVSSAVLNGNNVVLTDSQGEVIITDAKAKWFDLNGNPTIFGAETIAVNAETTYTGSNDPQIFQVTSAKATISLGGGMNKIRMAQTTNHFVTAFGSEGNDSVIIETANPTTFKPIFQNPKAKSTHLICQSAPGVTNAVDRGHVSLNSGTPSWVTIKPGFENDRFNLGSGNATVHNYANSSHILFHASSLIGGYMRGYCYNTGNKAKIHYCKGTTAGYYEMFSTADSVSVPVDLGCIDNLFLNSTGDKCSICTRAGGYAGYTTLTSTGNNCTIVADGGATAGSAHYITIIGDNNLITGSGKNAQAPGYCVIYGNNNSINGSVNLFLQDHGTNTKATVKGTF